MGSNKLDSVQNIQKKDWYNSFQLQSVKKLMKFSSHLYHLQTYCNRYYAKSDVVTQPHLISGVILMYKEKRWKIRLCSLTLVSSDFSEPHKWFLLSSQAGVKDSEDWRESITVSSVTWTSFGKVDPCTLLCVFQVVPGVLWSACMWGHKEGACVPHWRLFILCGVLRHHCGLCLPVFPRGHHSLHLLSEQVPWKQPRTADCEYSGLCHSATTHKVVTMYLMSLIFLLSYVPSGLCSDSGVLLHVAGQFLCLGQGSVWCESGHWSRWGAAPHLCLQSPEQQVWLCAWTALVWTQHLSGRFTGCVSQEMRIDE